MRKTTHALDAKAADAIEALSERLGVSRAEVVRRCAVSMQQAAENGQLPPTVANGYSDSQDDRTLRDSVGKDGSLGRAPALGDLDDSHSAGDTGEGVGSPANGSPEGDQRGSEDQDGEGGSILDKRIF